MKIPQIIAHRGYAKNYPENTLLAIQEALKAGARGVEFDVQVTADGVPVLFHDETFERTGDVEKNLLDLTLSEVQMLPVGEKKRFGNLYAHVTVPTLWDAAYLLKGWPEVMPFIELKEESLARHGIEIVVRDITRLLRSTLTRFTIISYNGLAIRCARAMGAPCIGWVMSTWDDATKSFAAELTPDYLFCNHQKIPPGQDKLWRGPWKWVMYEVDDPQLALTLADQGADYIETMAVGEMLQDPALQQGGRFADRPI